eukprot:520407-Alexandrium_andersonii.AAC.1
MCPNVFEENGVVLGRRSVQGLHLGMQGLMHGESGYTSGGIDGKLGVRVDDNCGMAGGVAVYPLQGAYHGKHLGYIVGCILASLLNDIGTCEGTPIRT